MYLSESQVQDYERDGAIVIKGVFKDWIDGLITGFDKVLADPSEHGRENVAQGDGGRFFEDYCNWQRIEEFKRWIVESPAAEIAAQAKYDVKVETTATTRTGISNYLFPKGKSNILLNLGLGLTNEQGGSIKVVSSTEIEGMHLTAELYLRAYRSPYRGAYR